ncbi:ig-like domain-containing protein [Trichonephila inaurata madagascariensis]|uniref:Ig-like domain-containing protein n=1 Tax=Trichonephila inaurata madagascariensis TaxID=2747483 RepID=A0A8X7BWD0_9ARAC|nr:ig-like domain-containing protein [Trichonephila inaurata madagascariensis]
MQKNGILCFTVSFQAYVPASDRLSSFDPKIPGYPRYYMDVNEEEGIYNLHIKNVNFQDEGEFQCQVGPSMNHTPIRAGAQLRILIPPDYLTVNGLGQASTMEVSENVSVRLSCQAVGSKPAAQLKWYKNSVEVPKGIMLPYFYVT